MSHNKYFLENFIDDEIIENIRSEILNFSLQDDSSIKYIKNINKFLQKNNIVLEDLIKNDLSHTIVYEYWQNILNIYKHMQSHTNWSKDTLNNYVISSTRIQEFLIFLFKISNNDLIDIFINNFNDLRDSYYFYMQTLKEKINEENFSIKKVKKTNTILLDNQSYSYYSSLKIQPFKDDKITLFDHFFKLSDHYVEEIFSLSASNNIIDGRNPSGQFGKRIPFEIIDDVTVEKLYVGEIEKNTSVETQKEYKQKYRKIQSPFYNKNAADLVNNDFFQIVKNNDISSKFKRFKISKAISNSITKRNLDLRSNYNFPELEVIKNIFVKENQNENIYFRALLLSFLTGFELKKLVHILLRTDTQITYQITKSVLKIKVNKKIFASDILDTLYAEDIKRQECEIHLTEEIIRLWQNTQRDIEKYYSDRYSDGKYLSKIIEKSQQELEDDDLRYFLNNKTSTFQEIITELKNNLSQDKIKKIESLNIIDEILDDFYIDIDQYLKVVVNNYPKRIKLSLSTISKLSLYYYRQTYNRSELYLLYTRSITTNDEARLCYCATRDRLYDVELWITELYKKIFDSSTRDVDIFQSKNWVGSPYYIKNGYFKQFIFEITKIKSKNDIDIFNLNMILIRYTLSLLLATRDFRNSCNLIDYSKSFQLLTIQEKSKNIYQSKRLIPLTNRANKIIQNFYILKEKYNISSYSPILLTNDGQEKDINKKNIKVFLSSLDTEIYQESILFIENFISNIKLNFGRHVVTSFLSSTNIDKKYVDAFLNHFKMGTEDQGIYSNFNNQDYINTIMAKIDEIETNYMPSYIKVGDYDY